MRPLAPLLALLVLAATAGCFGGDERRESTAPPADDPAEPAPQETAPGAPPEADAPPAGGETSQAPAAPAPAPAPAPVTPAKKIYDSSFDFASQGDPTGQNPKSAKTTPVLAGHQAIMVNLTLERSSSAPAALPVSGTLNSPMVRIFDPQGNEVLALAAEGTTRHQVPAVPGEWTIRYEGAGTLRATLLMMAVA